MIECLSELIPYADAAYAKRDAIQLTYDLTRKVVEQNIPGVLVECGVAAGAQIGVMGHCLRKMDANRTIYGFDSFQGIPLAGPNDNEQPGIGAIDPNRPIPSDLRELLKTSGVAVHSLDNVQANLVRWKLNLAQFRLIPGWFQDTMPVNDIDKIALLRLDGDLYESTKVCLERLYPKVQRGGFVIIDDYALKGCNQATKEYWATLKEPPKIIPVNPASPEVHYCQV